jgi:hypothetical protein
MGFNETTSKDVNHAFFNSPSKKMFYVLGVSFARYLAIPETGKSGVCFTRNVWLDKGANLLEIVKSSLDSEHEVSGPKHASGHSYSFGFRCSEVEEELLRYGLGVTKKDRTFPENIPGEYMDHFLRGFFDAQVTVSMVKGKKHRRRRIAVYFNETFLEGLAKNLHEHADVRHIAVGSHGSGGKLIYTKQGEIDGIRDFLYKDWDYIQESGLYLPFKMRRFERVRQLDSCSVE